MVILVGNVDPQTSAVRQALAEHSPVPVGSVDKRDDVSDIRYIEGVDLIVVAGWRYLIPPEVLAVPRYGTVGFHSARLPEHPGRAPVPWALLRGDAYTENTMFYLDEGVDTGDVIDRRRIALEPDMTPELVYQHMARTAAEMLIEHLPKLLTGTAPRMPQDMSLRGPVTTRDGWDRWAER